MKIVIKKNKKFDVHSMNKSFIDMDGSFVATVLTQLGTTQEEFQIAEDDALANDNNVLHFGYLRGGFIFSSKEGA